MRAIVLVVVLGAVHAWAQCKSDVDCKGDRICINGVCQDPGHRAGQQGPSDAPPPPPPPPPSGGTTASPPPPPPPPPSDGPPPPPPASDVAQPPEGVAPSAATGPRELPGWSMGGVVLGFSSAVVIAGFTAISAVTASDQVPSLATGGIATLIFAVTVPLVAVAGASVRNPTGAHGTVGLRVTGWILYGIGLASALGALVLGAANIGVDPLYIGWLGLVAVASETMMSLDALFSHNEATLLFPQASGPVVVPVFTLTAAPGLPAAPVVGFAGTF